MLRFRLFTVLCIALTVGSFFTGCSTPYDNVDRKPSYALQQVPELGVASQLTAVAERHPGESGFTVLEGNKEAFVSRVALADFAQETLDVQYYIWSADSVGMMLGDHLIRAADRGVRVRFLLDDVSFKKRDSATAALGAHPNIEVRIFNPHRYRALRGPEFVANFSRLNKRMHNKTFIMDNACVIIGGRNVADEYFGLSENFNNRDLDIVAVGPIVREVSSTFDEFWNSDSAVPIENIVWKLPDMDDFRQQIAELRSKLQPEKFPYPIEQEVAALRQRLEEITERMVWAQGEVLFDTYESTQGNDPDGKMVNRLHAEAQAAKSEVQIEQAYFVPRDPTIETFEKLVERGVKVRVLTNALAGNDVIAAQAGYARRRQAVIEAGVEVRELRPDAPALLSQVAPDALDSRAALHTKAMVIDGEISFVGSFNLDPRSADINSEIGLLVYSEALAEQVENFFDEGASPENSYLVTLDEDGDIVWQTEVEGETKSWTKDPETSWWRRFVHGFMMLLPTENQL